MIRTLFTSTKIKRIEISDDGNTNNKGMEMNRPALRKSLSEAEDSKNRCEAQSGSQNNIITGLLGHLATELPSYL